MTVPQTIEDNLHEPVKRFTELRSAGLPSVGMA